MKKLLVATILFFALGTNITFAQDYNKGLKAAQAGNYAKAFTEWKPLADQGHDQAQFNIGLMYAKGQGVAVDNFKALKWMRLSAEQGYSDSHHFLGLMYEHGKAVLRDSVRSHMWYNIASANGAKGAGDERNYIETKMSQSDISRATNMARECMNSNYKKCGF